MRCPICGSIENSVIDSRPSEDGTAIRRRRKCATCDHRFNTFERVEEVPLLVLKSRLGTKEPFDPNKLIAGMEKACKNRPISRQDIARIASDIEEALRARRHQRPRRAGPETEARRCPMAAGPRPAILWSRAGHGHRLDAGIMSV